MCARQETLMSCAFTLVTLRRAELTRVPQRESPSLPASFARMKKPWMFEAGVGTLQGVVQHYDWGGHTFIPDLLGIENATRRPFAELWIGAHAKAPSMVELAAGQEPLDQLIAEDPDAVLGPAAKARFGGRLPYLFKILD